MSIWSMNSATKINTQQWSPTRSLNHNNSIQFIISDPDHPTILTQPITSSPRRTSKNIQHQWEKFSYRTIWAFIRNQNSVIIAMLWVKLIVLDENILFFAPLFEHCNFHPCMRSGKSEASKKKKCLLIFKWKLIFSVPSSYLAVAVVDE